MLSAALLLAALGGLSWAYPSGTTPFDDMHVFKRISSGCGTSGQTSCHNTTRQTDLCCFESPGVREKPRGSVDQTLIHHSLGFIASDSGLLHACRAPKVVLNRSWKQFWDTNPSTGPSNSWTIHGERLRCLAYNLLLSS